MATESIYCLKCRGHQAVTDAEPTTMKNGRPAMKGTCPKCGGSVFRIGGPKS